MAYMRKRIFLPKLSIPVKRQTQTRSFMRQGFPGLDVRKLAETDMPEVRCPQDVLLPAHKPLVSDALRYRSLFSGPLLRDG